MRPPIPDYTANDLREFDQDKLELALGQLNPAQLEELKFQWEFWARPEQLEPIELDKNLKDIWLVNAGRGFGKTRAGAEWVRHRIKCGDQRIACVAPTKGDVRRVMVEGESGLLNVCWKEDKTYRGARMGFPTWSPTNNTLSWENGAKAEFFSAEDPERLRGPQFNSAWCFTAGHLVLTDRDQTFVEYIKPGDKVFTSTGFNKVLYTSQRDMPVGKVEFSDGTVLEGTYDHPIYTQDGWVKLGELSEAHLCLKYNMMESLGRLMPKATTMVQAWGLSIGMLPEKSLEILKASTSIIVTETNSTTTLQTCNSSQDQNTLNSTTEKEESPTKNPKVLESSLVMGVESHNKEKRDTTSELGVKVAKQDGQKISEKQNVSVSVVGKDLFPEWALCAVNVVSTWQPTGHKTVYNLQVENTSEYFCNGILTHNCDELAAWRNSQDVWDMLQFTLRLGRHPKTMITTTPKPTKLMRSILKSNRVHITSGSTFDNSANLAAPFLESIKQEYEGTRLGQQELYAHMLEEAEGALWTTETLDKALVEDINDPVEFSRSLERIVVAVDPAVTSNEESDMTGIVVAGIDVNGYGYVLEDATFRASPAEWAAKVVELYNKYMADRIVAEKNQGGEMVRRTIEGEDESAPIRLVHASRGKFARAEPISALYERGLVKHLKGLDELEIQMRTWEPLGSIGSPDRLDACVWALTELFRGRTQATIRLKYEPKSNLARVSL